MILLLYSFALWLFLEAILQLLLLLRSWLHYETPFPGRPHIYERGSDVAFGSSFLLLLSGWILLVHESIFPASMRNASVSDETLGVTLWVTLGVAIFAFQVVALRPLDKLPTPAMLTCLIGGNIIRVFLFAVSMIQVHRWAGLPW